MNFFGLIHLSRQEKSGKKQSQDQKNNECDKKQCSAA